MNHPLRLYFVGDEEGGEAVLAHNGRSARKFAWPFLDCEWLSLKVKWIKDARLQHISVDKLHPGYRLTVREGLKTGAFGPSSDDEGPECLRCGDIDCEGCAYRDHWLEEETCRI